ncbi:MAG TPA: carbamoyltransferase HypF [Longimicrobiales bacterium]
MIESQPVKRLRLEVRGAVQGVGFRPFVYRLASELGVTGWVANGPEGVMLEAEGAPEALTIFADRLRSDAPPQAAIHDLAAEWLPPCGDVQFEIRHSAQAGARTTVVLPDLAMCDDCRSELFAAGDRRQDYAFTNCTNCGPRFSIIRALPYDRPNTTMARFVMCEDCAAEYALPTDRRFHAQPNACPKCGPQLALWNADGQRMGVDDPVEAAARALGNGLIVAVKGIGGFHLMANADDESAVHRLRMLKQRGSKPFAVMVRSLQDADALCEVEDAARALLGSAAAPIVLMRKRPGCGIAESVAPNNPYLGVLLPYAPLHHLLMSAVLHPLVATSGNLSEEPICTDEREAVRRLGRIADVFLVHNRPIERHVDDSVSFVAAGSARILRRARGYAPLPVLLRHEIPEVLALGAHMKNTVALSKGRQVFLSQHIGDLEAAPSTQAFERVVADFLRLYESNPACIAHDLHPEYTSTLFAQRNNFLPDTQRIAVQHHHAHLVSCLAENGIDTPALGIVWDGTGLGTDGSIWGGEFLLGNAHNYERVATLRPFRLPGGDAAAREPRRVAIAMLYQMYGEQAFELQLPPLKDLPVPQAVLLHSMLQQGVRSPWTTSAGRLFDGIAALLDLRQQSAFEGDAAMALEFASDPSERGSYDLPLLTTADGLLVLDWSPLLEDVLQDRARGTRVGTTAARVHNALVQGMVAVARAIGQPRIALSGGCFQNRRLLEHTARALDENGFEVLLHRQVPPNDGGVSLGQAVIAAAQMSKH